MRDMKNAPPTPLSLFRRTGTLFWMLILMLGFKPAANAQALTCDDLLNISIGPTCTATITPGMMLEPDPNDPQNYLVQVYVNGVSIGNTIGSAQIGLTLLVKVTHIPSGNNCWGAIHIEDKMAPQISCPPTDTIQCNESANPYVNAGIGLPTVSDCSAFDTTYTDAISNFGCNNPLFAAKIVRTWTATDIHGYSSSCSQTIRVRRSDLANVQFPVNYDGLAGNHAMLNCVNPNTTPANTGYPTVNGLPFDPNGYCMLGYTYSDQVINLCGSSYKILRNWSVYDWCAPIVSGVNPLTHTQVIKVMDTTPPVIQCGPALTISTDPYTCKATVTIPPVTVSDDCSGNSITVITTTPFGNLNSNGGVIPNVMIGDYVITYIATDACGNSSSCTRTLSVQDLISPVAICLEFTVVSLSNNGTANAGAPSFDNGSYDNCCLLPNQPFEVRRMDQPGAPFGPSVSFTCADVPNDVMVIFRVWDCNGNSNTCMVNVDVQDKLNPSISCPPDITVACTSDYSDLTQFGSPVLSDNCSGVFLSSTATNSNITNCGTGTIRRIFTATDASGRTARCTQTITVENNNPFTEADITWPLDTTFTNCNLGGTNPGDLLPPYNGPVYTDGPCETIAIGYTDEVLTIAPPSCFKILRKWVIVDWCQYDPDVPNSPGRWEHLQVIKVADHTAPVIMVPANVTVNSTEAGCSFATVLLPPATATDCNPDVVITNNFNSGGANASGLFPYGSTFVTFTASDGCGNTAAKTTIVTVRDGKKPTPTCIDGLSTELTLMNGVPMAVLRAKQFNQSSNDNCTAVGNLVYSFSPNTADSLRVFNCDSLGTQIIDLWVTDESGNQDFCETYVIIQDNMGICGPAASVAGAIATEAGAGVSQVTVLLGTGAGTPMELMTNTEGLYNFPSVTEGNTYTVIPQNNLEPLNGVTTMDLVLISKHILGELPLNTPYKIIAADVNRSGSITAFDLIQLRQLILHQINAFPNNASWRFVYGDYVFPNPQNPFLPDFPEVHQISNIQGNETANFIAIKVGDVNNSAEMSPLQVNQERNASNPLQWVIHDERMDAGQSVEIAFRAKDFAGMEGFQFTLHFDPSQLSYMGMVPGSLPDFDDHNTGLYALDEGLIPISWNGLPGAGKADDVLFRLRFGVKSEVMVHDAIWMDGSVLAPEAYRSQGARAVPEVTDVQLAFVSAEAMAEEPTFELFQNRPNPFRQQTVIGFTLPESETATLTIYDVSGKVLQVIRRSFEKGYNEITLDAKTLPQRGVLYYKLETERDSGVKKMFLY